MNFFINGKILFRKVTGVERYAIEIIKEIDKINKNLNLFIVIPKDYDEHVLNFKNIKILKIGNIPNGFWWDQFTLPIFAKKNNGIVVSFDFTTSVLWPGISTIHDMSFKRNPMYFNSNWKQKFIKIKLEVYSLSAKYSKYPIFTVSKFQKKEIEELYHIDPSRIFIAENSWQHFKDIEDDYTVFEEYDITPKSYYLSLSSTTPNKNFSWVYEVARRNSDMNFVIVGSNTSISVENLHSEKNIKYIGYQSDQRVKSLYRECKAFLFPSLYEGFGIPPLEAMSVGAPIIISNTSCLPEIYEDSAAYIDPYNYNIKLNELSVPNFIEKRRKILNKYSWKNTAQKWIDCLRSLT